MKRSLARREEGQTPRSQGLGEFRLTTVPAATATRGAPEPAAPAGPAIYRFCEVVQVYRPAARELIREQSGDGIISATNLRLDARREPDHRLRIPGCQLRRHPLIMGPKPGNSRGRGQLPARQRARPGSNHHDQPA